MNSTMNSAMKQSGAPLPSPLAALLARDLAIGRRIGGAASMGVLFFLCLVAITPFAVGPDLVLLARIGPAILWISALLATLLGLDRLFQADAEDGSLDLFLLSDTPLEWIVLVKCLAHWLLTGLPLVVASPFFGLMLGLDARTLASAAVSLLVGTPALTLIGAIGAALTVGLRRGGLLLAILILPLSVPILIFGVAAASGTNAFAPPFLILCGLTLAASALTPFAAALALRNEAE
jgi:heme exporter protein B